MLKNDLTKFIIARLDSVYAADLRRQSREYKSADKDADAIYTNLIGTLTGSQIKQLNTLIRVLMRMGTASNEIFYRQGIKDAVGVLKVIDEDLLIDC